MVVVGYFLYYPVFLPFSGGQKFPELLSDDKQLEISVGKLKDE